MSDRSRILTLESHHWDDVRRIYELGMESGNATFETRVPDWAAWDRGHLECCRLVALRNGRVLGWAALSPVSARGVYRGVAEVSVYIDPGARGMGMGSALLAALVERSEAAGLWTLQAGIFPENEASLAIHEKAGFRRVGTRERLGRLDGRWRDVVLMERRSERVGLQ